MNTGITRRIDQDMASFAGSMRRWMGRSLVVTELQRIIVGSGTILSFQLSLVYQQTNDHSPPAIASPDHALPGIWLRHLLRSAETPVHL